MAERTTTELIKEQEFVLIKEGKNSYYGGNQSWYQDPMAVAGGCGTVALSNITAYLAKANPKYKKLYPYPDWSKAYFLEHMKNLYQFVKPYYLPIFKKPIGIWFKGKEARGMKNYCRSKGVDIRVVDLKRPYTKQKVVDFIRSALARDLPVAMLIGFNPKMKQIDHVMLNGRHYQESFQTHWVVITQLKESEDQAWVKVSSWGGYAQLSIEDFIDGERVYKCVQYYE